MLEFLGVTLFILLAAMAPGADFAMVMRNSLLYSRQAACCTALGVGSSMLVHLSYSLFGLAMIIAQSATLFAMVKYAGAAYLFWLGVQSLRAASAGQDTCSHTAPRPTKMRTAFAQGFFCNLLNPKAPLFFLAFYSVVVPSGASLEVRALYGLECAVVVGGWFVLLALLVTHAPVRRVLAKAKAWIARLLGGTMLYFAVRLALLTR
ncbi:resistance to homoserine/threonine (RhtB) family protein [Paucidesulfovibrio gracilis DSM 16080]|uniref:Resistance to homoserine/threonine (RhtB) family protein n=1 Tax=Paucidesulfovibrio gracilis DSM 16080 TaxID=1121449 RepID=A0A1T4Y7K3_9BACT|nr:LysE family transporter [Paucidesulfovibrio gracilis]SKA97769.1 resistance to homoserine/threonine (RhtB) family protein [Paucidesulfovibrio gracilis DSM 16080]